MWTENRYEKCNDSLFPQTSANTWLGKGNNNLKPIILLGFASNKFPIANKTIGVMYDCEEAKQIGLDLKFFSRVVGDISATDIDGLMQKRRNSIANTFELSLFRFNPSIFSLCLCGTSYHAAGYKFRCQYVGKSHLIYFTTFVSRFIYYVLFSTSSPFY